MQKAYSKQTSRWAIASRYFALAALISLACSFFFVFPGLDPVAGLLVPTSELLALVAFVCGVVALVIITIRRKQSKGYIPAITGILLSTPFVLMFLLAILVALVRAERARINAGVDNLRVLGQALIQYAEGHNGYLPVADAWCDSLMEYSTKLTENDFRHPKSDELHLEGKCHFAFNKQIGGMRLGDIPEQVVLVFEADGDWNLNGTSGLLDTRSNQPYAWLLLVDGTIKEYWFRGKGVRTLDSEPRRRYYEQPRWNP